MTAFAEQDVVRPGDRDQFSGRFIAPTGMRIGGRYVPFYPPAPLSWHEGKVGRLGPDLHGRLVEMRQRAMAAMKLACDAIDCLTPDGRAGRKPSAAEALEALHQLLDPLGDLRCALEAVPPRPRPHLAGYEDGAWPADDGVVRVVPQPKLAKRCAEVRR